jgi:hypothetical protein
MQIMMTAKTIVNIWMIGTSTMIVIKTATLGEGLASKDKKLNAATEEENLLYASWISQSPTNKVPKEFTIDKAPKRGPYSIYESTRLKM